MSIQHYCDLCGDRMDEAELKRVRKGFVGKGGQVVHVEVMSGVGGTWNAGHLHHRCVLEVCATGEVLPEHGEWPRHLRKGDGFKGGRMAKAEMGREPEDGDDQRGG